MKSPLRAERGEHPVAIDGETVVVAYDPDGESWFVRTSSVPGLAAEGETLDELLGALPALIRMSKLP